jgi:hypothetical protein
MAFSKIPPGPWIRIRPLPHDEVDPNTAARLAATDITWNIRGNLAQVLANLPLMLQTATEYVNSFVFDPPTVRGRATSASATKPFCRANSRLHPVGGEIVSGRQDTGVTKNFISSTSEDLTDHRDVVRKAAAAA